MSNSELLSNHPSDNKLSPFSLKTNQPFISLIKNLIKTKAVSPSNISKRHSISNINLNLNTKMKPRINLHSNKVSLSNLFSSNCNSNSNNNSNHHRNDIISPIKGLKKTTKKKHNKPEALSDMIMPNSSECIQSYDHISLKDKILDKHKDNYNHNDDTSSMNSINKYASYSDLSSKMNKAKIQRIEQHLAKNTIELDSPSNIKHNWDIYISIFNDVIELIAPSTSTEHQLLLIKLKEEIEKCFKHIVSKLNETEEEAAVYKKESNYNKRLCEKYSNIIKEYQKKTQETDYKIQFNNNHMLIDDNEDTTYNNSCCLFNKTKQVIVNNQSSLCSRNQINAANNNNNNNKTDDNISRDFSTKELESVCFADKVTMVKMNSLLNIPKLNFQKCKQEGHSINNQQKDNGVK